MTFLPGKKIFLNILSSLIVIGQLASPVVQFLQATFVALPPPAALLFPLTNHDLESSHTSPTFQKSSQCYPRQQETCLLSKVAGNLLVIQGSRTLAVTRGLVRHWSVTLHFLFLFPKEASTSRPPELQEVVVSQT